MVNFLTIKYKKAYVKIDPTSIPGYNTALAVVDKPASPVQAALPT